MPENSVVYDNRRERVTATLHRSEAWLSAQRDAFRAAVNDAPLAEALGFLIRAAIEQIDGDARCGFYIADSEGTELRHVVGMPDAYARHVEGFKIGLDSLACGLAVATKRPVITADVELEPRWAPWLWLARDFRFRACWSFPVETAAGKVVGTFAMYFREPREPPPDNLQLVATLTDTASIIISRHQEAEERKRAVDARRDNEAHLVAILNQLPGAVYLMDRDGKFLLRGGQLNALWGGESMPSRSADSTRQFRAYDSNDRQLPLSEYPGPRALRGETVTPGVDFVHTAADGRERWVRVSSAPFRDAQGAIVGIVATMQDIDDIKRTEARLRESQARLQAAVDLAKMAHYTRNLVTDELHWDDTARAMWGLPPGTPVNIETWRSGVHPDDLDRVTAVIGEAIDPKGGGHYELEYRVIGRDGVERWIVTRGETTFQNGKPVSFHGVALDVTGHKRAEQANLLLIAELQHRTRNLLAVVSGIATETLAASHSLADFGTTFSDRLMALSRVQDLLSRGDAATVTISDLVWMEIHAVGIEMNDQRVTVAGPDVILPGASVQILALAVHELVTNARKHGALACPQGRLAVTWHTMSGPAEQTLVIEWREQSGGRTGQTAGSARKGFGRTLIEEALPHQLDARTQFHLGADGVFCSVVIGLDSHKTGAKQWALSS